jgi:23S rRNA (adenine2503-C2)-methyltransferase
MISVYDTDRLGLFCRENGIYDHALKRLRNAFFKKALPVESCLAAIPENKRAVFAEHVGFHSLEIAERHDSKIDGASKLIFVTPKKERIEAVILRIGSGRTSLCISSQIGCGADCGFCATGRMGLSRNLTTAELLDQVVLSRRLLGDEGRHLRNVVMMGMGEPFHNETAVCEAMEVLRDPRCFYFSERHLLVSTVGVHRAMVRFVERFPKIRIALSLHSARQEVRERIMPTGSFHSLEKIRDVLPTVAQHGNFMVEYLLLQGVNDGPEDLAALIEYLRDIPVHINLIQFNAFPGTPFQPVTRAAREAFGDALRKAGFKVTLRYSLGDDIAAACGQLAGTGQAKSESLR